MDTVAGVVHQDPNGMCVRGQSLPHPLHIAGGMQIRNQNFTHSTTLPEACGSHLQASVVSTNQDEGMAALCELGRILGS